MPEFDICSMTAPEREAAITLLGAETDDPEILLEKLIEGIVAARREDAFLRDVTSRVYGAASPFLDGKTLVSVTVTFSDLKREPGKLPAEFIDVAIHDERETPPWA
jgi:hypothetical protein